MNLALKDATLDHLMVTGLNANALSRSPSRHLPVARGHAGGIEGKMTATTSSVEIK